MDSEDKQSVASGSRKPEDLDAYLSKNGTIKLSSVLTVSGKRFSELESLVGTSPATLSDRLDGGLKLYLLKLDSEPEDYRQTQRYYATGYGKEIAEAARQVGIHESLEPGLTVPEDWDEGADHKPEFQILPSELLSLTVYQP